MVRTTYINTAQLLPTTSLAAVIKGPILSAAH